MTPTLLILTVGTGTAGKHSNLAQGLVSTLKQIQPRAYWLTPSESVDSTTMAELIRQEYPDGFMRTLPIPLPDDIFSCRETVRAAIREAKGERREGERIVVNPTSGTKQMSAGATLAALDEEIGDLVFTIGDRQDGVVVTGTERLADFSTSQFFFERDARIAKHLFDNGAFWAAAELMSKHLCPNAERLKNIARCAHEWLRQNYEKAAAIAATVNRTARERLQALAVIAEKDQPHPDILADMTGHIQAYLTWNDSEQAVACAYKALEYAAKVRLIKHTVLSFPLRHKCLMNLPVSERLKMDLRMNSDGSCTPGLSLLLRLLDELNDDLPASIYRDPDLKRLMESRNRYIHDITHIESGQARRMGEKVLLLLNTPAFPMISNLKFEISNSKEEGHDL